MKITAYCRWYGCRVLVTETLDDLINQEFSYAGIEMLAKEHIPATAPLQKFEFDSRVPKSALDQFKIE